MDMEEVKASKTFGIITENDCQFLLYSLTQNDVETLPLQANAFYELYLEDAN